MPASTTNNSREILAAEAIYTGDDFCMVTLHNRIDLFIPLDALPGVCDKAKELIDVELCPRGAALRFPKLGLQFTINDLVLSSLDEPRPIAEVFTASDFARRGGLVKSEAKAKAARANGKRPKRPRSTTHAK